MRVLDSTPMHLAAALTSPNFSLSQPRTKKRTPEAQPKKALQIHTYMICMYIHTNIYVYVYTSIIYICIHTHVCIKMCKYMYTNTSGHTPTHYDNTIMPARL